MNLFQATGSPRSDKGLSISAQDDQSQPGTRNGSLAGILVAKLATIVFV